MNSKKMNFEELQADVLVIGGGGAGLPAAASAVEAGAKKVVIIDKRKILGGCARLAVGLFAAESPAQKRLGIHFTADECFSEHMEISNWNLNARLVRTWFNESKEIIRWLEEKGAVFGRVIAMTGNLKTYHIGASEQAGKMIVKVLSEECKKKGVQLLMQTKAEKLLLDENGEINGVLATREGKEIRITAKSVIIATGSITANEKLLKRFFPGQTFENTFTMSLPFSTGDGLIMAEEAGCATNGLISRFFMGPCNYPYSFIVGFFCRRPHMMWVNKNGMRYIDESVFLMHPRGRFWLPGMALNWQPAKLSYSLMDKNIKEMIQKNPVLVSGDKEVLPKTISKGGLVKERQTFVDENDDAANPDNGDPPEKGGWLDGLDDEIQKEANEGRAKISDSWDEIAQWMDADPLVLKSSIDQYNLFCRNEYDADFLKPKEWLLPLSTPPYYAIRNHQGMDAAIGGIRISHRMEVLNRELKPIGGLYAAGVATSGWLGVGYGYPGSELSFSIFSGYSAGKIAATHSKSK